MAANAWTIIGNPFIYRLYDLTTLTYLGRLPFTGVSFGRSLNQPGPFQGTLNIADPQVQALAWRSLTLEARTLCVPELYGTPLGAWEIWASQYQESGRGPMAIQGADVASYFQERNQAYDYTSTWNTPASGDPMSIMAQLFIDAIAQPGGNPMGLTSSSVVLNPSTGSPSGAQVSVSYPASSLQQVDSMEQTLSQMGYGTGPDYSFDVAYQPGTKIPVITINIWSPTRGRTVQQSSLQVERRQLMDFYYPVNGKVMGNNITEAGSGTGGAQPVTINLQSETPGYPLYDKSFVHTQVNTDSALEGVAFGDASLYAWPAANPWIKIPVVLPDAFGNLDPAVPPQLGTFDIGDNLEWNIDPVTIGPTGEPRWGENNSPRFPTGFQFEFRIQDWVCNVSDKGVSYVTLDLAIPATNALPPTQPPL
jgi:hypothetical protein